MKSLIIEILYKCSKNESVGRQVFTKSSILTFLHSATFQADFKYLDECTLCLPSLITSYAKTVGMGGSKERNCYIKSATIALSFYLRRLIDSFNEIQRKRLGYDLLIHVLNQYETFGHFGEDPVITSLDIKNIIVIADGFGSLVEAHDEIDNVIIPSKMMIQELLPANSRCDKNAIITIVAGWMLNFTVISFESPNFFDILLWITSQVAEIPTLCVQFARWIIICRLSTQNFTFKTISKSMGWDFFMKKLYIMCDSKFSSELMITIYPTLFMMIIRDMGFHDSEIVDLVAKIPNPRSMKFISNFYTFFKNNLFITCF